MNVIRLSMSNETKINVVRFKTNPTNFYLPFIELALSTFVDYKSFLMTFTRLQRPHADDFRFLELSYHTGRTPDGSVLQTLGMIY